MDSKNLKFKMEVDSLAQLSRNNESSTKRERRRDVLYRCSVHCFLFCFPSSLHFNLNSCLFSALFTLWFLLNLSFSVLPHSQPSSCSPSPALSTESLSSASDHSSAQPPLGGSASNDKEHAFTKSVSEPSICSPCDSTASPSSSSTERLTHPSQNPYPCPTPSYASSAPATPQTSRSMGTGAPPPRPLTTPSPLASGANQSHNKVIGPPTNKAI